MFDKMLGIINKKVRTIATGSFNLSKDPFYGFSLTYATSYSICYIVSGFLGLYLSNLGPQISTLVLFGVGVGTLFAIYSRNIYLLGLLALGEAVACVLHYIGLVPWVPAFSDTAYITMAVLDLIQSIVLFRLMYREES